MNTSTCEDCKFCVLIDNGYSNWTVEGTDFNCYKDAHPDGSFDRWYGDEDRLKFAAECPEFVAGDSIHMDVDREDVASLTDEQKEIWKAYE